MNPAEIIDFYNLEAHPEGGAFSESYRCKEEFPFNGFSGERSISTAIYFLLQENEFSAFHRIKSDELWHFYLGAPIEIIEINEEGELFKTILGSDFKNFQKFQYNVKANNWFASRSLGEFSFVGCTVAPGFDFRDFKLANYLELKETFPQHDLIIKELTQS